MNSVFRMPRIAQIILGLLFLATAGWLVHKWHHSAGPSERRPVVPAVAKQEPQWPAVPARPLRSFLATGFRHPTLGIKPDHGIVAFSPTVDGNIVYSCQLEDGASGAAVCIVEPSLRSGSAVVRIVATPQDEHGHLSAGRASGPWVVYAVTDPPQRIAALNTQTGERIEVGRISTGAVRLPVGPSFAITGTFVIYADEVNDKGVPVTRLIRYDLNLRQTQTLRALPAGRVISDLVADEQRVVYCQESDNDSAPSSEIHLLDVRDGKDRQLSHSGQASMPGLHGDQVVWKLGDVSSYGQIFLHSLSAGAAAGRIIASAGDGTQRGYDMPTIGNAGVTWLIEGTSRVVRYLPASQTTEVIDDNGDRAQIAGHYMAWISGSIAPGNEEVMALTDLSRP